jgi:hypothetical protein
MITRKELFSLANCCQSEGGLICSTALFWVWAFPIMAGLLLLLSGSVLTAISVPPRVSLAVLPS